MIELVCPICENPFLAYPSEVKKGRTYCSRKCKSHNQWKEDNPNKGGELSFWHGRKHSVESRQKMSKSRKGRVFSEEWRKKLGSPMERNGNWKGGKSFIHYPPEFNRPLKRYIRERDESCRICFNKSDEELSVHHIDYDKNNNNTKNLIGLCRDCHLKTNFNREYWERTLSIYNHFVDERRPELMEWSK
jgi:hypothetical protein